MTPVITYQPQEVYSWKYDWTATETSDTDLSFGVNYNDLGPSVYVADRMAY